MKNNIDICREAEEFIRDFFKIYLEDRNFPAVISMLHKDISWFGTGVQEICRNYHDAQELLELEGSAWNGRFRIVDQWYQAVPLSGDNYLVSGELVIVEDGLNTILLEMRSRFSMICAPDGGELKLYHGHFSVPNSAQKADEFIHKTVVADYNTRLEEKLQERTRMLKDKMRELEALTDNIFGGVQICGYDDGYTIKFISDGFTVLTGYTKEDIAPLLGGKHLSLVYKPDIPILTEEIRAQLSAAGNFSVEYRIVRKDGKLIWVTDKGTLIQREDGSIDVQCILSDITVRKEQEEALQMSEKRYEIAMKLTGITMFEYNLVTKELLLYEGTAEMYGMPSIIRDGMETFISKGIVEPVSVPDYREMYRKIHNGEPTAGCFIKSRDTGGRIHDFELSLTNVFDRSGKPVRAIGVRKNVSEMLTLQTEQEFSKNFVSGKSLLLEADISNDKAEYINEQWIQKIGGTDRLSYVNIIIQAADCFITPEQRKSFIKKLFPEYIKTVYEKGSSPIIMQYKYKDEAGNYIWHEALVNIIKDQVTGNIRIRFYHMNISEVKKKEQRILGERRMYESMISKAKIAYEVNITKNVAVKGHENWETLYGIQKTDNYSQMIQEFSQQGIHPEDRASFVGMFQREDVLSSFTQGRRQMSCQYRKMDKNGTYRWVDCILHLYEEIETGDVKGFSYVKDIDEKKRAELTWKYNAEHDIMTGIFNKATTEQKIYEYLKSPEGDLGRHAFWILDIDYFKFINDNFGHLFGDSTIKEIAGKIASSFTDRDIVGRIGGDEFCVFMKNVDTRQTLEKRADELCRKIKRTYVKDGKSCTITASIGIALCDGHGLSYEELYKLADDTLYTAKKNGRNRYEIG